MNKALYETKKISDLKDLLNQSAELFGEQTVFKLKTEIKGEFKLIKYKELKDFVDFLGTKLIEMGLKGERIAVIGENRHEWCISYLSVSCGTGIIVPLDKSLPANEIESLLIRSEVKAVFYTSKYDEIMKDIRDRNTTKLQHYISMDLSEHTEDVISQTRLIEEGKKLVEQGNKEFINAEIERENMAFMLFTSGTTAMSKAVMLSHNNICANIMQIASVIKVDENDSILSFLPLHHTFECTVGFLFIISRGATICYCDGIRHIADNIKEFGISVMISVPILFEGMYKKVMKGIEKKGILPKVQKGIKISNILRKFGIDVRQKLFKELHANLGENLRLFVSGAAALDPVAEKGFNELGFNIYQGYGLTETSPVLVAGNDKYTRIGAAGKAFPGVEIKIDNPNELGIGEVIAKGPNVMLGYYQNEEATNEVLKNGWFYTGDLGYVDKDGFLFITGRKKNVIVLKNGKNIFPEEIESSVNRIEGVKESFIYGKKDKDDDLIICAKIVYDKETEITGKGLVSGLTEEQIRDIMWEEIKKINKTMPPYKYIRELIITDEELIKTTTQKVKRHEEIKKVLGE